jgi:hypothetical protein
VGSDELADDPSLLRARLREPGDWCAEPVGDAIAAVVGPNGR